MKRFSINAIKVVVVLFALVGFGLCAAYVGVNLHLTNTDGIIDRQADVFWNNGRTGQAAVIASIPQDSFFNNGNYCALKKIKDHYPGTFWRILNLALNGKKELAQNNLNVVVSTLSLQSSTCEETFGFPVSQKDFERMANVLDTDELFILKESPEWSFFKTSVVKDADVIKKVESETGIKGRVLVSILVAEQMRLFYSDRAWFEQAIAPTKVLATMSQFSLGVLGIKAETAQTIETNLKDSSSAFYPGPAYEHMLDFSGADVDAERFTRLTNSHDHYFAYLYAALYAKEVIAHWQKNGIDISDRPEILATLYNIGFEHSVPKSDPQAGGAAISIEDKQLSFGGLAYNFYYSGELLDVFPQ